MDFGSSLDFVEGGKKSGLRVLWTFQPHSKTACVTVFKSPPSATPCSARLGDTRKPSQGHFLGGQVSPHGYVHSFGGLPPTSYCSSDTLKESPCQKCLKYPQQTTEKYKIEVTLPDYVLENNQHGLCRAFDLAGPSKSRAQVVSHPT